MMPMQSSIWPNNAACAVMITVNLDAEYAAKAFSEEVDVTEGSSAEILGRDGMESGLPRLLQVLDKFKVPATFFVQGKVALKYGDLLGNILDQGHEIGCRGYENENLSLPSQEEQANIINQSKAAIIKSCGVTPIGFRAPAGELTLDTLKIVKNSGFFYSSTLCDNDTPYFINGLDLLEIPIHPALYDYPYFVFHFDPPIPSGQSRISYGDDVLANWQWEYDGYHRYGGCCVLQLDPQITGSQGRIYLLEKLLEYIKAKGNCWFATGAQVHQLFLQNK